VISFTDDQLRASQTAATPVDRFIRSAFINAIGQYFHDQTEVGDGELGRALKELQREFLNPPRTMKGARPQYGGSFNRS
jgi:hypothetical protein